MRSTAGSSIASADLPPGTLIAGHRLERVLGRGSRATVYEAIQIELDRRVAFKLIADPAMAGRVRRLEWPEHPGAVRLFGTGDSDHGPWLAMQLVPGETLETVHAPLDAVAAALAQGHADGIVHGTVTARNVLVAGDRAYLSDFGLAPGTPTAADDRAALARLAHDHPPPSSSRRRAVCAGAAVAVAAAGIVGVVASGGGSATPDTLAAAADSRPIGSQLERGEVETVDCAGRPPGGSSLPCSVSQRRLAGREIVVPDAGTITSWAVRGARGGLSLQVLRGRGGRFILVDESAEVTVPGTGLHRFTTKLAVAAGDRLALEVAPGAAVGIRRATSRTSTERWFSPLHANPPSRLPDRAAGTGLDHELLLRADVSARIDAETIAPLAAPKAARAPAGLALASREVTVGREVRTVTLLSLGGAVALDLFDGPLRLARVPVSGADGRGRLGALEVAASSVRIVWRNPGGRKLDATFGVAPRRLSRSGPTS